MMTEWIDTILQGVMLGGLYALYGTGLSLIFGVMRVVNLAHGDFIVLAAFLSLTVTSTLGLSPLAGLAVVFPSMLALGILLQRALLNRVVGAGLLPSVVITFGLSVIIQNALQLAFSADARGLDAGSLETASIPLGGSLALGIMPLATFLAAVAILLALQFFFSRTRLGRAFRAASDDPATAELLGIDSRLIYGLAMGLSLGIVAVAGVFLGIRTNFAPSDGPSRLILAFEAVIIGGMGNLWGTLAGGVILGVAQAVGARFHPAWFQLAGYAVTLLVLAFRPSGLMARTRD